MLRCLSVGLFAVCSTGALAQDLPFIMEDLPPHIEARVTQEADDLLLDRAVFPTGYFVTGIKVWPNSEPLKVCFFGGSTSLRARIAAVASQWSNAGAKVPLDFGNPGNPRSCGTEYSQIRIGFRYKGYWSTVGTDSDRLVPQAEQSMNFALFDIKPPGEPEFSRVVLHEFGHALGFQHEHQSALAPCAQEFDWDAIYTYLQGHPNYWPIEQIDHNLKPIAAAPADAGPFDRKSIMLYAFPASFYKSGVKAECLTLGNNALSEGDIAAVRKFYPADAAQAAAIRQENLQAYFQAIDQAEASDLEKSFAKLTASGVSNTLNPVFANKPGGLGTMKWDLMMMQMGSQLLDEPG